MSIMPSRRDILRLIGAGAAAAFARSLGATDVRVRFPKGAVIRTVLKDLPPEALAGGATLFHEHLSVGADFMQKVMAQFRILLGPDAMLPPLPPPEQQRLMRDLGVIGDESAHLHSHEHGQGRARAARRAGVGGSPPYAGGDRASWRHCGS
jgi:hypothetical protein